MFSSENVLDTLAKMDKEQIVFLAGVTLCALSIGAFIFWGPNPRPRRRGPLIGLQNLGLTCFLNTLLQALASCAVFMEWLESCRHQGNVASALYYLLKVLSGEHRGDSEVEDPLAPAELMLALQQHGWSISRSQEQDAHELFHLLMVTLEEEAHKAAVGDGGLSDSLEPNIVRRNSLPILPGDANDNNMESDVVFNKPAGDSESNAESLPADLRLVNKQGDLITRKIVPKYDCNRNYQASPFCGLLTSQLQCVQCGYKSVLRYDKFDSLSLHFPDNARSHHTLYQLLDHYTLTEAVGGVACEGCNQGRPSGEPLRTATSLKSLSIGKLPKCLCIHIHRISMGSNSTPYKRPDYVDFPEYLIMDPYTHNAIMKEQKLKEESTPVKENNLSNEESSSSREENTKEEAVTLTVENNTTKDQNENTSSNNMIKSFMKNMFPSGTSHHMYRVKAVVVHQGSVESGHFVTYRRGPLRSHTRHRSDRWYFTSDETVRDASLAEAMQSAAYLLFYEKCTMTPT